MNASSKLAANANARTSQTRKNDMQTNRDKRCVLYILQGQAFVWLTALAPRAGEAHVEEPMGPQSRQGMQSSASHGTGAAQVEACLRNFDSEPTDDSSTGPSPGQSKRRATPTDCLTPTPKFQRARKQCLKADSLTALPASGWDEIAYTECAAERRTWDAPKAPPQAYEGDKGS